MTKVLTTKVQYEINYDLINKKYDFYEISFSKEKGQFKRDRGAFYDNVKSAVISFGFGKTPNVFCVPKKAKENFNSDYYKVKKYNDIKEIKEDTLLNLIGKLSHTEESDFKLLRDLFYEIGPKNKDKLIVGCEPRFKNGCINVNVVSYVEYNKKNAKHVKSNADRADIIKNKSNGRKSDYNYINNHKGVYIKMGSGDNSKSNVDVIKFSATKEADYSDTKVAVYKSFIKMLNESKLIKINLKEMFGISSVNLNTSSFKNKSFNLVNNKITAHGGINIINYSKIEGLDNKLKDFLLNIENYGYTNNVKLEEYKNHINIDKIFINSKDESIPQIWLHSSKDEYGDNEEDPYKTHTVETVKQSITGVEDYLEIFDMFEDLLDGKNFDKGEIRKLKSGIGSLSLICRKCLHELCIKLDIKYNEKPTFIEEGYNMTGWSSLKIDKEDWVFKYSDVGDRVEVSIDSETCSDIFRDIKENQHLVETEKGFLAKIEVEDYKIMPDFYFAEEIFKANIDSPDAPVPIERERLVEYAKEINNSLFTQRLSLNNKPYFDREDIKELVRIKKNEKYPNRNDVLESFEKYFFVRVKPDIRSEFKGRNIAEPYKKIVYFGNGLFSVGELANTRDLKKMIPVFKITFEKDMSDDDTFNLIKKLYVQYFVKMGYATRKPYFAKYIREAYKMDSYY